MKPPSVQKGDNSSGILQFSNIVKYTLFRNQIIAKRMLWLAKDKYQQWQNTLYYANITISRWAINTLPTDANDPQGLMRR